MSTIVTDSKHYSDIANAIRGKNETSNTYKPSEMALAIRAIEFVGIPCTLTVQTGAGASVTATLGSSSVSATADSNGTATLILKKEGTWTLTATLNGTTKSTTVNVEHSLSGEISLVNPILANNSWEKISEIAKAGKASQYWNVGDTKTFTCNGYTMTAQIIGFDHDNVTNASSYGRTKAGITFQFKDCYPITYIFNNQSRFYPYSKAYIRSILAGFAQATAINDLASYIVPVNKDCIQKQGTNAGLETISDSIFLLSEFEVAGTNNYAAKNEGTQYAFYAAGNSRIKNLNGSASIWMTRTVAKSNESLICSVTKAGGISYSFCNDSIGVAPAFCL